MLLLREGIEMFCNMFWIKGESNVYFNIRGEESVIQTSFNGEKYNLLYIIYVSHLKLNLPFIHHKVKF